MINDGEPRKLSFLEKEPINRMVNTNQQLVLIKHKDGDGFQDKCDIKKSNLLY